MTAVAGVKTAQRRGLTRRHWIGLTLLGLAGLVFLVFLRGVEGGQVARFGMQTGAAAYVTLPDLSVPALPAPWLLGAAVAFLGGYQLSRASRGASNLVLGLGFVLFLFAFLVWATAGKRFSLAGMLTTTIQAATPIALGAMSGIFCERAGVINIAIEGMMLSAAFTSVLIASATDNLWLGLVAGVLTGVLLALLHAVLSVTFRVDQIVSGTVINILAAGLTSYLTARVLVVYQHLNDSGTFKATVVPVLGRIPFLGPLFFQHNVIIYLMLVLVPLVHLIIFQTRWGLRTRAVGEHPRAADTLGISVHRMRYLNVLIGGGVAGLGGAYFTLGSVGRFDELMTAGRGFIGLAAMIFGKWTPFGAFASSLIFGFADSLQTKMAILRVPIPSQFLAMAPYVFTMIVLAGLVGRAIPPAAIGRPYEKD